MPNDWVPTHHSLGTNIHNNIIEVLSHILNSNSLIEKKPQQKIFFTPNLLAWFFGNCKLKPDGIGRSAKIS